MWFLYMIKNSADKLYVGITQNPKDRVAYHNQKRGAAFTKHIPTYKIVFLEKFLTLAEARGREIQIKKWSRKKKEFLIKRYQEGAPTTPTRNK
jgi:putative endonuclease